MLLILFVIGKIDEMKRTPGAPFMVSECIEKGSNKDEFCPK